MLTRRTLLGVCIALGVMATARVPSVVARSKTTFAIVVAKDSPVNELSFGDLKRLYMGEAVMARGVDLKPFALKKERVERAEFDQLVMGMDPETVGLYWTDRKIRGQTGAPKAISDPAVLVRVVGAVPGAVGYVPSDTASGLVKVLRIDGKLPQQPGYRLGG